MHGRRDGTDGRDGTGRDGRDGRMHGQTNGTDGRTGRTDGTDGRTDGRTRWTDRTDRRDGRTHPHGCHGWVLAFCKIQVCMWVRVCMGARSRTHMCAKETHRHPSSSSLRERERERERERDPCATVEIHLCWRSLAGPNRSSCDRCFLHTARNAHNALTACTCTCAGAGMRGRGRARARACTGAGMRAGVGAHVSIWTGDGAIYSRNIQF